MEYNEGGMALLSLLTLGAFTVTLDGVPVAGFEYNKVRALLVYLAVEADRSHHREVLAELLWPERPADTARANLRKTLSTLRQAIHDTAPADGAAPPFLLTDRETVQFNTASPFTLDLAAFTNLLDACRGHRHARLDDCAPCLDRLAQAAEVYRGDFLHQFFLNDSPAFDDWAWSKREAGRRLALGTLTQLAAVYEARREYETAARHAQRQVALEPWAEGAHRQLMRLYAALGQRSAALAQFEACRRALADELGVEPDAETAALYDRLRLDEARVQPVRDAGPPPALPVAPPNPYARRAMIKEAGSFVGRRAEIRALFGLLASLQSCSVVGPRRIGKSSLLYHLAQPAAYRPSLPDPDAYVFAFVDLQELAGGGPEDFFRTVGERLIRAGGERLANLPPPGQTLSSFRYFLEAATARGLKLVVACDEFEMFSSGLGFGADFFASLRGLSSNHNLALVTASQNSLFELCHQGNIQTSHFWNIFTEQRLGLMPEAEARELLAHPSFTPDDREAMLALAGPHPFFLQIAAYHTFEARAGSAPLDRAVIEERFFDEARRHYAYVWDRLPDLDRQALRMMAQAEPVQLNAPRFQILSANALVVGEAPAPALASAGWQRFVHETAVRH